MPRSAGTICLKAKKEIKIGMVDRLFLGPTMDKENYIQVRVQPTGMKSNGILQRHKASVCKSQGLQIDMENASK